jgi:hypothetical protein
MTTVAIVSSKKSKNCCSLKDLVSATREELEETVDAPTGTVLGSYSKHARRFVERVLLGLKNPAAEGRVIDFAEKAKLYLGGGLS